MTVPLKVLIVDTSDEDALLFVEELKRGGYAPTHERVETLKIMKAACEKKNWDVVISNFQIGKFTGLDMLKVLKEEGLDVPFIIVSDTMSEAIALQCLKAGAHSFFKKKNIKLLVPAVERGLREVAIQRERKRTEEALISSNQKLHDIIEFLPDATFVLDNDKKVIAWNRAIEEMTGIKKEDMIGQGDNALTIPFYGKRRSHLLDLIDASDKELESKYTYVQRKGDTLYAETFAPALYGGKGAYVWATGAPLFDAQGNRVGAIESIRDITEKKRAEETLRESQERFRQLSEVADEWIWEVDSNGLYTFSNSAIERLLGYTPEEIIGKKHFYDLFAPEMREYLKKVALESFDKKLSMKGFLNVNLHKNGWRVVLETNGLPIIDEGGNFFGYRGADIDVTERTRAEEALKFTNTILATQEETSIDGILVVDEQGKILSFNQRFVDMWGIPDEVVKSKSDARALQSVLKKLVDPEEFLERVRYLYEHRMEKSHEEIALVGDVVFERYSAPMVGTDGTYYGRVWYFRDITERKHAEDKLRESEEKYRALVETTNTGYLILDFAGTVLDANDEYARLTGRERRDEILGRSVFEWTAVYDRERNEKAVQECVRQGFLRNFEVDYVGPQGQVVPIEINATLVTIKNESQILGLCRDITERKHAEENLLRIQMAIESGIDGIGMSTPQGVHFYQNQAFTNMFGYSIEELSTPLGATIVYADAAVAHEVFEIIMQGGFWKGEVMMVAKGGRQIPVALTATAIKDHNGKIIGLIGIHTDITERKKAEEALRQSERKYRALFESSTDSIMMLTHDGFFDGNQSTLNLFGFESKEEFITMHPSKLSPPSQPDGKDSFSASRAHIATAYEKGFDFFEWTHRKKDGTLFPAEVRLSSLELGDRIVLQALVRDVTERKQSEQERISLQTQLQQSQKMEAIGQLAGGIAHDFNNILTIIHGYCELTLLGLRESDPARKNVEVILKSSERATNLTAQLLAFSRRQILQMQVVSLNSILEDLDKMLRRVIGEDIELNILLSNDLGVVKADPGQIEQVIMNLVINAKDAMPRGGKLFFETANVELDEEYARTHAGILPGPYVELAITDTGEGMSKEVREQIFDPFFTTKEKGKGSGLGLSTVYGIVKQSGGDIYVYSEIGKGTTFKLYLPRVFESADELKKTAAEKSLWGKETVLVVEDDNIVLKLTADFLRNQGYNVLEASEGGEALLICERETSVIDLILTDVIMPRISGPQLIERLRKVRTDFKVLYMTGYTDEAIVHHGILEKGVDLIKKPFSIEKLTKKVREVLNK